MPMRRKLALSLRSAHVTRRILRRV